jgi:hypothetical protein
MNTEYVIEEVGDRQYCNGVDVTDHLCKYHHNEWSRLPYELKGDIYWKKQEQGGACGCGRGREGDRDVVVPQLRHSLLKYKPCRLPLQLVPLVLMICPP